MTIRAQRRQRRPSRSASALGLVACLVVVAPGPGELAALTPQSRESATAQMPRLTGRSAREAQALLERLRMGPASVRDTLLTDPDSGTVVRQSPPAGARVRLPVDVTLWVARPPRLSRFFAPSAVVEAVRAPDQVVPPRPTMPDLRERPVDDGRAVLKEMGLEATVQELPAGAAPPGIIVRHLPEPGAPVEPGTLVRLWVAGTRQTPVVPDVRGEPLEVARELFNRVGLQVARVEAVPVDPRAVTYRPPAEGTVVRQLPAAGTALDPGATGTLWVAEHSRDQASTVETPDVLGMPLEDAVARMKEAGIGVTDAVRVASDAPAGTVVEQKPPPGMAVAPGAEAALAVSEGARIAVPDLRGATLQEAEELLAARGLRPAAISQMDAPEPGGTVLRQAPGPGTQVPLGAGVDLAVSAGLPEPETAAVPDLAGADVDGAERRLREAGFRLGPVDVVSVDAPPGTVVDQWPPAGAFASPGAPVRVRVSGGVDSGGDEASPPVAVPEVVGLERAAAATRLADAGLAVVQTRGDGDRVADQFPSPGTLVAPGTPILLTLQAPGPDGWLRRWPLWGVPAGAALLWVLLRIRRVRAARRRQDGDGAPGAPRVRNGARSREPEDGRSSDARIEYRLACRSPRGEVEVDGPLLPELEVGLRPRPGRALRVMLEVPRGGPLAAREPGAPPAGEGAAEPRSSDDPPPPSPPDRSDAP